MKKIDYQKNRKFFSAMTFILKVVSISIFTLFFIWAIVDPTVFQYTIKIGYAYGSRTTYFGVMQLESGFGVFMIWILIGGVLALITYFLLKIHIAYKMVVVVNLEKLSGYDEYVDVLMAGKKQTEESEKPKAGNVNQ